MEELANETCPVIYFCPAQVDLEWEHYRTTSPPLDVSGTHGETAPRKDIYANVRALLDADRGGYEQVYLTSRHDLCLEHLDSLANTQRLVLLIDIGCGLAEEKGNNNAFPLLRKLALDGLTACDEQRVLPFLLTNGDSSVGSGTQSELERPYLDVGALALFGSPLTCEGLNGMVSQVKEYTRPGARQLGSDMAASLIQSLYDRSGPETSTHRPDLTLSIERQKFVESAISGWRFPAHDLNTDELALAAILMLEHLLQNPDLEPYRLSRAELVTFVLATRRQYKHEQEVFYHNWRHAVDVTQSIYIFLCGLQFCPPSAPSPTTTKERSAVERLLTPMDALTLLISAVGHDVGHPGVNNAFLVASNHRLAQLYNDKSVLENYHCSAYSQLLRRHWSSLGRLPHFRTGMISNILATDMQRHFEYMGQLNDLKEKLQQTDQELTNWNDKDKQHAKELALALLIKGADISNVARPFDISAKWAIILMNEFARQGELESELQIPTCLFGGPPDKEDLLAAAQSQKGFMSLFGLPLFRGLSDVLPSVACTLPELDKNMQIWERRISDEIARREAQQTGAASPVTYDVPKEEVEEARARKRDSEPRVVPLVVPQTPSREPKRQVVLESQSSPARHPAGEYRQRLTNGASAVDHKRSSAPLLGTGTDIALSPGASRRSSKDVALTQLRDYSAFAPIALRSRSSEEAKCGGEEASWSIHQNYPASRRGSKDESLTTILVTSQSSEGPARNTTGSPVQLSRPQIAATSSNPVSTGPNQSSRPDVQASNSSLPPSRTQTASSGTMTTERPSSSTQPSSIATLENEGGVPIGPSVSSDPEKHLEDAGVVPGKGPKRSESNSDICLQEPAVSTPPTPALNSSKSSSPRIIARMTSSDMEEASQIRLGKADSGLRESRSRSRLRGLKFWKKRRDPSGAEVASGESTP